MLQVKSFEMDKLTFAPTALSVYLDSSNTIDQTAKKREFINKQ